MANMNAMAMMRAAAEAQGKQIPAGGK